MKCKIENLAIKHLVFGKLKILNKHLRLLNTKQKFRISLKFEIRILDPMKAQESADGR